MSLFCPSLYSHPNIFFTMQTPYPPLLPHLVPVLIYLLSYGPHLSSFIPSPFFSLPSFLPLLFMYHFLHLVSSHRPLLSSSFSSYSFVSLPGVLHVLSPLPSSHLSFPLSSLLNLLSHLHLPLSTLPPSFSSSLLCHFSSPLSSSLPLCSPPLYLLLSSLLSSAISPPLPHPLPSPLPSATVWPDCCLVVTLHLY